MLSGTSGSERGPGRQGGRRVRRKTEEKVEEMGKGPSRRTKQPHQKAEGGRGRKPVTKDGNYKELLETIMKLTRQNVLQVGRIMNLVAMIQTMAEYEQDSKVLHTMHAEVKMCLATLKKRRESEEEGARGSTRSPQHRLCLWLLRRGWTWGTRRQWKQRYRLAEWTRPRRGSSAIGSVP